MFLMTEKVLKKRYLEYNARYISGRLPAEVEIRVQKPPSRRKLAGCLYRCVDGNFAIYINPVVANLCAGEPIFAHQTLIHEMCHLYLVACGKSRRVYSGHGRLWQNEMKRIAASGGMKTIW